MFADLKNDDERDRKESNEGCQDAAEARAVARARNESKHATTPCYFQAAFLIRSLSFAGLPKKSIRFEMAG